MTAIHRARWIVPAALAILLVTGPAAHAEPTGIVVVTGKIAARERTVIEAALVNAMRTAAWSLSAQRFAPKEIEIITRCLRDDQPWRCLSPLMQPKGVDRIVVADVNPQPDAASKLVIVGELVTAGDGAATVVHRRCDGCDDASLTIAVQHLASELLHDLAQRSETILELRTVPPGATVTLDGQPLGASDAAGKLSQATIPGPHKVIVEHPGFVHSELSVDLPAAKTTPYVVELVPDAQPRRPRLVPLALVGAGVAAVAVGGYLIYLGQQDGPDDRKRYTRATPIGVVTGVAGAAAISYGVYLWLHHPAANVITMSATPGGLVAGWSGTF
jgi:hypothetical protein